MAGNQPTLLLKSQNNINLYKKFNSQLNLTEIFAKYAYWQASPVEPELGTAQPQLVSLSSSFFPPGYFSPRRDYRSVLNFCMGS
jgi:hypothetical protein